MSIEASRDRNLYFGVSAINFVVKSFLSGRNDPNISKYSSSDTFSVVRLHTYARDNALEVATGFFITGEREGEIRHALVTNWHVLAGRNPLQPTLTRHRSGAVPDSVRFTVHRLESEPGIVTIEEVTVDLYDSAGHATWSQHPSRGRLVDVGILEFGAEHVAGFNVQGVNAIASANDMAVRLSLCRRKSCTIALTVGGICRHLLARI